MLQPRDISKNAPRTYENHLRSNYQRSAYRFKPSNFPPRNPPVINSKTESARYENGPIRRPKISPFSPYLRSSVGRRRRTRQHVLHVGPVVALVRVLRADEPDGLEPHAGRQRPVFGDGVLQRGLEVDQPVLDDADRVVDLENDPPDGYVVLDVLPNACGEKLFDTPLVYTLRPLTWRIVHDVHPDLSQMLRRPDAAQHQQLRRVDRPCRQDDLLPRPDQVLPPVPDHLDRMGALRDGIDVDLRHVRPHGDVQVRAESHGPEEGLGGAASRSSAHGELPEGETSLLLAVDVSNVVTHLLGGLEERNADGSVVRSVLHRQVTAWDVTSLGKWYTCF